MFTTGRSCWSRCRYSVSGSDLYFDRQSHLSLRETSPTSSQPLCTITQTLAAKRHSWRETSLETHRATRETVQSSGKPLHRQKDHHRAPTRPDRVRATHRYSGTHQTQEATTQEK